MFTDVSSYRELHPGFEQSSFMLGRNRVLLHKVAENVPLRKHRHMHAQFGYNFWGKYEFMTENAVFNVQPGSRYLLDGLTHHAANATTEYYSMDYKFISNNDLPHRAAFDPVGVRCDILGKNTNIELEYFNFDLKDNNTSKVIRIMPVLPGRITLQLDKRKTNLAVTGRATVFRANDFSVELKSMHIYKLDPVGELTLHFDELQSELLILCI